MTIWWIPSSGCQEHSPEKNRPPTSAASSVTRRGWTNVYEATGEMYAELIDMFFRSEMGFRAVIVDKSQIDETRQDITKTYIYDTKEKYVIVLECHRKGGYFLLTAYYLNRPYAEKGLKKKMKKRLEEVI